MSCPSLGLCKLKQNNHGDRVQPAACSEDSTVPGFLLGDAQFEGRVRKQSLTEAEREASVPSPQPWPCLFLAPPPAVVPPTPLPWKLLAEVSTGWAGAGQRQGWRQPILLEPTGGGTLCRALREVTFSCPSALDRMQAAPRWVQILQRAACNFPKRERKGGSKSGFREQTHINSSTFKTAVLLHFW